MQPCKYLVLPDWSAFGPFDYENLEVFLSGPKSEINECFNMEYVKALKDSVLYVGCLHRMLWNNPTSNRNL